MVEPKNYHLVIRVSFDALDDVQARQRAKAKLAPLLSQLKEEKVAAIKLQKIREGKSPVGVKLNL